MIIDSMGISMGSARSYHYNQESINRISDKSGAARIAATHGGTNQFFMEALKIGMTEEATESMEKSMLGKREKIVDTTPSQPKEDLSTTLRRQTLLYLLMHLHQIMKQTDHLRRNNGVFNVNSNYSVSSEVASNEEFTHTYEKEETVFQTSGMVKTADGREISFNVSLGMSREFEEYYYANHTINASGERELFDPLVLNLDGGAAELSDQKFFFDIDADGKADSISRLKSGSGYLALDKNGDGIINDGNELFGTKSSDGFADLAKYDHDGNGWIDEADDIFSKLKIWTMDTSGKSSLLSLKELGIGAICLSKTATSFALNQSVTNEMQGMIRSTGLFLFENGKAGTVQQIDLAR